MGGKGLAKKLLDRYILYTTNWYNNSPLIKKIISMDILIQSLGFKASEHLENFIREKLNKVVLESDNVIRANVTLTKGPESELQNNVCEVRLEVPGNDHFVKKSSDVFEKAISESMEALQKIIRKTRDKQISSRHSPL